MFARTRSVVVATFLVVGFVGACSSSGSDAPEAAETTTTAPADPSTTEAPSSTTTTGSPPAGDPWTADAQDNRGRDGEQFEQECPEGGEADTIWGVELYTDDSSICTAAVHVGLITFEDGGAVTYEIAPGEDSYDSGIANDVTSLSYRSWGGSFLFPEAPPGTGEFEPGIDSWVVTPMGLSLVEGDTYTHECGAGGEPGRIWGTTIYTGDSSICTAAVHAGRITADEGGTVAIEVVAGEDTYEGSEANGVLSSAYGSFSVSFRFADDQPEG